MTSREPFPSPTEDRLWIDRLRQTLDHASEHLPDDTRVKLRRARQQALSTAQTGRATPPLFARLWPQPAGLRGRVCQLLGGTLAGTLAAALLAITLWPQTPTPVNSGALSNTEDTPNRVVALAPASDMALLSQEDFLLLEEDLAFYAWLESEIEPTG